MRHAAPSFNSPSPPKRTAHRNWGLSHQPLLAAHYSVAVYRVEASATGVTRPPGALEKSDSETMQIKHFFLVLFGWVWSGRIWPQDRTSSPFKVPGSYALSRRMGVRGGLASEPVLKGGEKALGARSDLKVRAVIQNHSACHPGADENVGGNIRQTDADRNPLSQPDPGESRVHTVKELGPIAVVVIGNAAGDALNASL